MARPKANPGQHLLAHQLWRQGKGQVEIRETLEERFEDPVSERTVGNWIRGFKAIAPEDVPLDIPFTWAHMQKVGLPWEASGFIMVMLKDMYRSSKWIAENREWFREHNGRDPEIYRPTFRDIIWWWRVHKAAPEIYRLVGQPFDVRLLGDAFAIRELIHEVLAVPLVTDDLEACLALKPWLSNERHENYHRMLELGLVPPLRQDLGDMAWAVQTTHLGTTAIQEAPETPLPGKRFLVPCPDHAELLHSQQLDMVAAENAGQPYSLSTALMEEESDLAVFEATP